jgi:hypothetical protein
MEVWNDVKEMDKHIPMGAVDVLRSFGYESYSIDQEGELKRVNGELSSDNYIFKKPV